MYQTLSQRLQSLMNSPWFIRTVTGKREEWEDARGDPTELANKACFQDRDISK